MELSRLIFMYFNTFLVIYYTPKQKNSSFYDICIALNFRASEHVGTASEPHPTPTKQQSSTISTLLIGA